MKWEHFALKIDTDDLGTGKRLTGLEMQLDDVGIHGWELVSVDDGIAYFKRAINEQEPNYFTPEYFDKINEMAMKQIAQAIVEVPTKQSYDD